jgi:hypothetical protein
MKINLKKALFWWWFLGVVFGIAQSFYVGHSVVAEPILNGVMYFGLYWWCQCWRT